VSEEGRRNMFKAKVRSDTLKGLVNIISTLVDEAKFNIGPEGMSLKAVDPAHVAMIELYLKKSAFEEFVADETSIGIDLDKIRDVLKLASSGDVIQMEQEDNRGRLVIKIGNIVRRMNLVDTSTMGDPRVPELSLPANIEMGIGEIQKGIKAAESVSDHIALSADQDSFELYSEGDTDSVSLRLEREQLIDLKTTEKARSLFPLDYFSNLVKAVPSDTVVRINLGNNYPVKITFDIADGNGKVGYLLAPRIESD